MEKMSVCPLFLVLLDVCVKVTNTLHIGHVEQGSYFKEKLFV